MKGIANMLKALADETRLNMIALLLKKGELCVCDFVSVLGITQSKASRHLRYLANAGLLDDRREAVWVYYKIADKLSAEHKTILKAVAGICCGDRVTELFASFERCCGKKCK